MAESKKRVSVLIVGAGPTGLVLALWLQKRGIDFRIIDKSTGPGETSRALAIQARTLEFYQQLGFANDLVNASVKANEIVLRRRGRAVATAKFGELGKDLSFFSYLSFCSQDIHEALLCTVLEKWGRQVQRNSELLSFSQNENEVIVQVKTSQGTEQITADYLIGCDGAHSAVRHGLKTKFPGGTYSQVFFVADVMASGPMAEGGLQISVSPKGFCIVMPIRAHGSVRLTGIVPPEAESKEKVSYDDVAESVARDTGLEVQKVNWFSSYHVHHRVAGKFHDGRVFLAGDAGHIHSPAGGQGMNTGIGDAVNLAWKLADVIQGRCPPRLLDSYEPERISFAKTLVKTTDVAFQLIASRSYLGSMFRAYVLPSIFSLLTRFRTFLDLGFKTISQIRIEYRESFLSEGSVGEVHAGDRLPWVRTSSGHNFESLQSLDWQIHIYGKVKAAFQNSKYPLDMPVHQFEWSTAVQSTGLQKDAVYLIRPDGYIALATQTQDSRIITEYFQRMSN
ncbi:MAG: monooxygenase [Bdellovibrio sp. CG10_big_fil_rev_8_21_14_0_10_47_8]|nr:MAG: monooxygenase [Bdellovibrio sp. CG10_big_fil_rev_8_21_14_0_10_47_8]